MRIILAAILLVGSSASQSFVLHSRFSEAEVLGDLDRDGVSDYALGIPGNRSLVLSARNSTRLFSVPGRVSCRGISSDFDGDGTIDIVTDAGVFSGKSGRKLPLPWAACSGGDVDRDRQPDLLRTYSTSGPTGPVHYLERLSGKTGNRISQTVLSRSSTSSWRLIGAMPDVTKDGVPEPVLFESSVAYPFINVLHGVTGKVLVRIFGFREAEVLLGDVSGDAIPDLLVAGSGAAAVYSGSNWKRLVALSVGGDDAAAIGDHDGDGKIDVAVTWGRDRRVSVLSSRTWKVLTTLPALPNAFGYRVRGLGDLDGDRKGDFFVVDQFPSQARFSIWLSRTPSLRADEVLADVNRRALLRWSLEAGATHANRAYLFLGSVSGTSPGFAVGTTRIPLNPDPYTLLTIQQPTTLFLQKGLGTLDAKGRATVDFVLPPGLSVLRGLTLHHAYVADSGSGVFFASNPVPVVPW